MATKTISRLARLKAIKSGQVRSETQKAFKAYQTGLRFTDLQLSRRCKIVRHEVPDRRKKVDSELRKKGFCIKLVERTKCKVTKVTVGVYQMVKVEETKKILSEKKKGINNPNFGKPAWNKGLKK